MTVRMYDWRTCDVERWNKHHMERYVWDQQVEQDSMRIKLVKYEDLLKFCDGDLMNEKWQLRFRKAYDECPLIKNMLDQIRAFG